MGRCRDCSLYDLAAVLSSNGRVLSSRAARCKWVSTEPLPLSVRSHQTRVAADYMEPNDGDGCPCFSPNRKDVA